MSDNASGMPYLRNHLESHGIFTSLAEEADGDWTVTFLNPALKGLQFVFDRHYDFRTAEYLGDLDDFERAC